MDLEELRAKMNTRRLAAMARDLDVPYQTIICIANGRTISPGYELVLRIIKWMENN